MRRIFTRVLLGRFALFTLIVLIAVPIILWTVLVGWLLQRGYRNGRLGRACVRIATVHVVCAAFIGILIIDFEPAFTTKPLSIDDKIELRESMGGSGDTYAFTFDSDRLNRIIRTSGEMLDQQINTQFQLEGDQVSGPFAIQLPVAGYLNGYVAGTIRVHDDNRQVHLSSLWLGRSRFPVHCERT